MNNKVLYTIIIPHYNTFPLLLRCLKTIPQREDVQVIVIDDCSTDEHNPDSILKLETKYMLELFKNTKRTNAGACRNVGLKQAKGKWLLFADSDDFFSPNLSSIMDYYAESSYDLIYFKTDSVFSDDINTRADRTDSYNDKLAKCIQNNNHDELIFSSNVPWGKLIARDLVQKYCIHFEEIVVSNDAMFSMLCAIKSKKILLDKKNILYIATKRTGSLDYTINTEADDIRMECAYRINKLLYEHRKGKYRRNLFGISNRIVFKWKYLLQYNNLGYFLYDLFFVLYGKLNSFVLR